MKTQVTQTSSPKAASLDASPPSWRPAEARSESSAAEALEVVLADVRKKIYPRSVSGLFARWRWGLVAFTQLLYYGLPWLQWNDRQAVLFDLGARKFYIFGMVLWPQDVIYLTLLLIISALGLFLFTAIAGRLFCGYACPQTVYTEIFMWIERKVEGDRIARIRLDEESLSLKKIRIKTTKHALWFFVAFVTGFTFIGYFAPIRTLGYELITWHLGAWQWFWLVFYSFATWGNAGFLREQVCKYMCPYARFQSVMVDSDTYVVTYDYKRGEPRGARSKKVDHHALGLGDCVDCSICVQVCPTGIDIRQGLQYMCIGCGACIDACNQVMNKLEYPKGLIRYTSESGILKNLEPKAVMAQLFRPRIMIYSALMIIIVSVFFGALATRETLRVDVIRDRGMLGREIAGGLAENVYRFQLINASETPLILSIKAYGQVHDQVQGQSPLTVLVGSSGQDSANHIEVPAATNLVLPVVVHAQIEGSTPGAQPITFVTTSTSPNGEVMTHVREASSFIFPK